MTTGTQQRSASTDGVDLRQPSPARVLMVLCFAQFMAALDLVVVNVAFPSIGADFPNSSLSQLSWVLNGYIVVYAALLVPAGRLADRYGRRTGLFLGLAVFTLASAACAASDGVWWLVGFRVAQATGAAVLTPASLGLVIATTPPERRVRSVAIWVASGAVSATFGPVLGGLLVEASWRWIFLINLPVGVLAVLATIRWVPQSRDTSVTRLPDLLGAALLAASVGGLSLGLVKASDWGWHAARTDLAWAVAALALVGFVTQSKRHASPVIAPRLLQVRTFVRSNVTVLAFGVAFGANLLAAMLWLQQVWGYSPLRTGLAITPGPLVVPLFTAVAQRLSNRIPIGFVVGIGCLLLGAGGFLIATQVGAVPSYTADFLPFWLLEAAGVGLALPAVIASATADLPPADAATGSGVVTMNQQIGMAVGVSLLVAVLGTPTTYAATHAGFQHLWWSLTAVAVVAGASAARISPRRAVQLMP